MRVLVLNGVNLDILGRRDPKLYGGLSIAELESRIYEWARELELTVQCRQTNDEGEFVKWCHDAYDTFDAIIVNPAAWTHYAWAIHDALESLTIPIVEVHLSNVDEREEWRRKSVVADLVAARFVGHGPDGYKMALDHLKEKDRMSSRIERLRELLEEPLLVTNLVNVLYLTGFDSSNAALLVEPDRARLFTDFRYIESARAIEGVEAVQTKRAVIGWLCENLSGRIGFEADVLPWSFAEQLREAGIELVPRKGLVEQLRAVKDEGELETFRRACAITDRMFERLVSEVPFVGRRERDVAWDITRLYHEEGADEPAFEAIVGSGPTGARPHGRAGDRVIEAGELVVIDTGANVGGYVSDYTRTLATGELDGEMREAYDVVLAAQQAGLDAIRAGVRGIDADAAARGVIEGSDFAGTFGHGLGHGLGLDVHESPRLSTESSDTLVAGNVVTVEPGVYLEGRFGIRIEDDVVVTDDGIENPVGFTKELLTVG